SKVTDGDFSDVDFVVARFAEDFEQYSQEIRLLSPTDRKVDYVIGAYYHQSDLYTNRQNSFNRAPLNGTSIRQFAQDDRLFSVFGQARWHLADTLRLSGSLRYTNEEKEGFITRDIIPTAPGLTTDFGQVRKEEHWDPAASIEWDLTSQAMLFLSYT